MGRTIENAQWKERRPRWYVLRVQRDSIFTQSDFRQSDYQQHYVGLGSFVWERIATSRRDGRLGEWIRDDDYNKLSR